MTPPTSAPRIRSTSFISAEDELLKKGWMSVSENTVVGSNRKGKIFYKAVNEYYELAR